MKPGPIGCGSDPDTPLRGGTLQRCTALFGMLAMVLLLGLTVWPRASLVNHPVGVEFTGLSGGGVHLNPFGHFTITNRSSKPIRWSAGVEAAGDPHLALSLGLSSSMPGGLLPIEGTNRYTTLVACKPGIPFRAVIHCYREPKGLKRLWLMLSRRIALMDRIWRPNPTEMDVVYGDWQFIDSDYESNVIAKRAPFSLDSAD